MMSQKNQQVFGYVQFQKGSEARGALQQLNGLRLLGQNIKVSQVDANRTTGFPVAEPLQIPGINTEQLDEGTAGVRLTAQSRQILMQRLSQSSGFPAGTVPPQGVPGVSASNPMAALVTQMPQQMASQFVQLQNMFDPSSESEADWELDIQEDVEEECSKFGKVLHVHVDKNTEGHVFMKFDTPAGAQTAVSALNGRWFAQKQIIAGVISKDLYEKRFPESKSS
eukprot:TRINITY_DN577_c0_g1_i2.p1 TRINITY_DN577_c0_g1~~TRINITY_DN577_c0_g1_i2.p1  ORF type:complete len:224 (-),score=42.79 TRINITY_DN577_c0_g1_i2:222-893(-)